SRNATGKYELKRMLADGSEAVILTTIELSDVYCNSYGFACGISWSPDGNKIAFSDNGAIAVINRDGTGREVLTGNSLLLMNPSWSPDGGRIAFTVACE